MPSCPSHTTHKPDQLKTYEPFSFSLSILLSISVFPATSRLSLSIFSLLSITVFLSLSSSSETFPFNCFFRSSASLLILLISLLILLISLLCSSFSPRACNSHFRSRTRTSSRASSASPKSAPITPTVTGNTAETLEASWRLFAISACTNSSCSRAASFCCTESDLRNVSRTEDCRIFMPISETSAALRSPSVCSTSISLLSSSSRTSSAATFSRATTLIVLNLAASASADFCCALETATCKLLIEVSQRARDFAAVSISFFWRARSASTRSASATAFACWSIILVSCSAEAAMPGRN
mmetsp:Transcript_54247/g.107729  ORF Transcript_54247/g.107729 Transcript_54247/m.107729 type:complete len:298 (-) Transcript_54247:523-1416(-)